MALLERHTLPNQMQDPFWMRSHVKQWIGMSTSLRILSMIFRKTLLTILMGMSTIANAQVLVDVFHWGEITKETRIPGASVRLHNLNSPNEIKQHLPHFSGPQIQAEKAAGNWVQSQ